MKRFDNTERGRHHRQPGDSRRAQRVTSAGCGDDSARPSKWLWSSIIVGGLALGACDTDGAGRGGLTTALQGERGPAGPQGPRGFEGERGRKGDDGPTGPQGPQGWEGAPGPDGPDGETGAPGPAGEDGLPGPAGNVGPRGVAGRDGADSTTPGPAGPQGPQGPQGAPGAPGVVGPQGARGVSGATGPAGDQGPKGLTGPAGAVGPQGPSGISAPGPQGPQGPVGLQGPAGETGATGPTGAPGTAGVSCAGDDCVPQLLTLRCTDREQPQANNGVWSCQATNIGARRSRAGFIEEFDSEAPVGWTTFGGTEFQPSLFDGQGGAYAYAEGETSGVLYTAQSGVDLFATNGELQVLASGDFPQIDGATVGFFSDLGYPVGAVEYQAGRWFARCSVGGVVGAPELQQALLVESFRQVKFTLSRGLIVFTLDGVDASTLECGPTFTPGGFGIVAQTGAEFLLMALDYATWRTFR